MKQEPINYNPVPRHMSSDYRGYLEYVLKGGPGTKRFSMNFPVNKALIPEGKTVIKKKGYTLRMKKG